MQVTLNFICERSLQLFVIWPFVTSVLVSPTEIESRGAATTASSADYINKTVTTNTMENRSAGNLRALISEISSSIVKHTMTRTTSLYLKFLARCFSTQSVGRNRKWFKMFYECPRTGLKIMKEKQMSFLYWATSINGLSEKLLSRLTHQQKSRITAVYTL